LAVVEIYTTRLCPFCIRAKSFLRSKGVEFTEIAVDTDIELRREMTDRSGGGTTVPQIFINDAAIGGSDDLIALESDELLDDLLATEPGK
jgi:glutaredoxin 3